MEYFDTPGKYWGLQKRHRVDHVNKTMGSLCTSPCRPHKQEYGVILYPTVSTTQTRLWVTLYPTVSTTETRLWVTLYPTVSTTQTRICGHFLPHRVNHAKQNCGSLCTEAVKL